MENTKLIAIIAVAVIIVVGAAAAIVLTNDDKDDDKDKEEVVSSPEFTIQQTYNGKDYETLQLQKCDRLVGTSTIYMTTIYYLLCEKYEEKPYSAEALANKDLVNEFQFVVAGGTPLKYIQEHTELGDYFDKSKYYEGNSASLRSYEKETMMQNVADAVSDKNYRVLFMGSYVGNSKMAADYTQVREDVKSAGAVEAIFPSTTDFKTSFAGIELVAYLFGYEKYVDGLISDLQTQLYDVYVTVQEKEDPSDQKVCYWESGSGKSVKMKGMAGSIIEFLGWKSLYSKATAQDTEAIIAAQPDIIIFYTNDTRSDADKGLTQYTTWEYTKIDVDMGGITATPKFVESVEQMCEAVYGEVTANKTLDDAKADSGFWDKYANFESMVTLADKTAAAA